MPYKTTVKEIFDKKAFVVYFLFIIEKVGKKTNINEKVGKKSFFKHFLSV